MVDIFKTPPLAIKEIAFFFYFLGSLSTFAVSTASIWSLKIWTRITNVHMFKESGDHRGLALTDGFTVGKMSIFFGLTRFKSSFHLSMKAARFLSNPLIKRTTTGREIQYFRSLTNPRVYWLSLSTDAALASASLTYEGGGMSG